jgi:hypothetical protein
VEGWYEPARSGSGTSAVPIDSTTTLIGDDRVAPAKGADEAVVPPIGPGGPTSPGTSKAGVGDASGLDALLVPQAPVPPPVMVTETAEEVIRKDEAAPGRHAASSPGPRADPEVVQPASARPANAGAAPADAGNALAASSAAPPTPSVIPPSLPADITVLAVGDRPSEPAVAAPPSTTSTVTAGGGTQDMTASAVGDDDLPRSWAGTTRQAAGLRRPERAVTRRSLRGDDALPVAWARAATSAGDAMATPWLTTISAVAVPARIADPGIARPPRPALTLRTGRLSPGAPLPAMDQVAQRGNPTALTSPDATSADTASPGTASLDTATLDTATLDTATLDTATLDTATSDTASLDTATPDTPMSDMSMSRTPFRWSGATLVQTTEDLNAAEERWEMNRTIDLAAGIGDLQARVTAATEMADRTGTAIRDIPVAHLTTVMPSMHTKAAFVQSATHDISKVEASARNLEQIGSDVRGPITLQTIRAKIERSAPTVPESMQPPGSVPDQHGMLWYLSTRFWDGDLAKMVGTSGASLGPAFQTAGYNRKKPVLSHVGTGLLGLGAVGDAMSEYLNWRDSGRINWPKVVGGGAGAIGAAVTAAGNATGVPGVRYTGWSIQLSGLLLAKAIGEGKKWENVTWPNVTMPSLARWRAGEAGTRAEDLEMGLGDGTTVGSPRI